MIALPKTILVATEPVNFHLSFDRLAAIVREQLGGDRRRARWSCSTTVAAPT